MAAGEIDRTSGFHREVRAKAPVFFAVMALGYLVTPAGAMSPVLRHRATSAVEHFLLGHTQRLILSGGRLPTEPRTAAASMKEYALKKGVPEHAIYEQGDAQDTIGEAIFSRFLLWPPEGASLLLITSDFHVSRAEIIFKFVYGPRFNIAAEGTGDLSETGERAGHEASSSARFEGLFTGIESGDEQAILQRFWSQHALYADARFADLRRRTFEALAKGQSG